MGSRELKRVTGCVCTIMNSDLRVDYYALVRERSGLKEAAIDLVPRFLLARQVRTPKRK